MSALSLVRSRGFIALLVLAVAFTVAVACNGDGDENETPTVGQTPAAGETPTAGGDAAEIRMITGTAFDKSELAVAADTSVTITADNTDGTHSFAVYESEDDALAGEDPVDETEICSAPCTDSVTVNLAAGDHFFRCEVHPTIMTGTLTAQ